MFVLELVIIHKLKESNSIIGLLLQNFNFLLNYIFSICFFIWKMNVEKIAIGKIEYFKEFIIFIISHFIQIESDSI